MKSYNIYYKSYEFSPLLEKHGLSFAGCYNDIKQHFKTKYNAHLVECDRDDVHYYVLKFNTEKWYTWFLLNK